MEILRTGAFDAAVELINGAENEKQNVKRKKKSEVWRERRAVDWVKD